MTAARAVVRCCCVVLCVPCVVRGDGTACARGSFTFRFATPSLHLKVRACRVRHRLVHECVVSSGAAPCEISCTSCHTGLEWGPFCTNGRASSVMEHCAPCTHVQTSLETARC
ncbi:hypothetical protein JKP88DRAFT_230439 [Tribonema minus]|uniref:Secreted protein n=1 Tax=Tribonema minus TaxID=303371 RepID=A0A835ZFS6_9STRA|nr:hypothetical protein JKP88DRAFT_230439 [Tribonema minus]